MTLYNIYLSNFASKCRIVIYEKGTRVEIAPIPGGDLKSAEYLKIYPLGKTPSLVKRDDFTGLAGSIDFNGLGALDEAEGGGRR